MIGPNLSAWSLKRPSLIVFLMIVVVAAGVLAFKNLGRDEDAPFTVRTMIVAAGWPGATVEEMTSQVTERLERTLQETHKFDAIRSYTTAGQTTIFVDLDETTATKDIPDVWYRVRRNIGDMRLTLPQGVIGPFFNDDFGDTFGIIYGFTADGFNFRELRDYVEAARSKILQVPDVAKVEILGAQDERIFIEFSAATLASLRLDYGQIVATLQAQNVLRPAGVIQTDQERVYLRVTGAFDNEKDIENVSIASGDRTYRLGDIARVYRGVVDPPTPMFRVNGKPAIGLAIAMRDRGDILALGHNIREAMADIKAALPVGIEPVMVADQSQIVDHAINDFLVSLYQAIAIILVCSFLSLGVRPGIIVALAIPITLALVFAVMDIRHINLQRVSLGALIIALTLLVDDAMTTVDAMLRRLKAGDSKDEAASYAYKALAAPMLIGTLITIASFVPVGFAPGGASEVLSSLFSVVAISLVASWLVAVIVGPILGKAILKVPEGGADAKPSKLVSAYAAFLGAAIRFRWVTIGLTIAVFVAALYMLQFVPRQFFPSSDRPELLVDLTLRQNASIYASEATAKRVEALLDGNPDVERYSTYVGRGAIRFYLPLSVHLANPFFSQIVVIAKSIEARDRLQAKLQGILAVDFPDVVARVSSLEMGPPVGWPVQYRVTGPDIEEVRRIAQDVAQIMGADARVSNVNFDWMEPARQVRVQIDQDQARRLGVSSRAIAAVLNAAVTGSPITQVRDDIYLVNVIARSTPDERVSFESLASLAVPTPAGRMIPLSQFARFSEEQEFPLVWRRDRVPTLTVRSDVVHGVLPEAVVNAMKPAIDAYNAKLPRPYRIEIGGTYESSNDSSANVFSVVPIMILLMLTFMMLLLVSFRRMAMVLFILPLGLIGVVAALLVFQRPLGFVAILGILALIGMIAKNAVILIVSIEAEREAGKGVVDAVFAAAKDRLTPLVLTAISTVLGLIPIAPTIFWGPMAFAIMGGLLVASLLTLILLPTLYVAVFGREDRPRPPAVTPAAP
ncbi:MAG: efflux RND transporter permease subunit [Burkholderiales bacterium]|nr:efflux RND transporter permease subunit [Burkholderiales bacterium]